LNYGSPRTEEDAAAARLTLLFSQRESKTQIARRVYAYWIRKANLGTKQAAAAAKGKSSYFTLISLCMCVVVSFECALPNLIISFARAALFNGESIQQRTHTYPHPVITFVRVRACVKKSPAADPRVIHYKTCRLNLDNSI
jgi:hypothetical protein